MECFRKQGSACSHPSLIERYLPFLGGFPFTTHTGIGPRRRIQGKLGARRAMVLTEEQSLRQAITREEGSLAALEQKQQKSRERLAALKAELTALVSPISIPSTSATQPSADIPTTPKMGAVVEEAKGELHGLRLIPVSSKFRKHLVFY